MSSYKTIYQDLICQSTSCNIMTSLRKFSHLRHYSKVVILTDFKLMLSLLGLENARELQHFDDFRNGFGLSYLLQT